MAEFPSNYRHALHALLDAIATSGVTQADLARQVSASEKHVSQVVNGKAMGSWRFMDDCMTVLGEAIAALRCRCGHDKDGHACSLGRCRIYPCKCSQWSPTHRADTSASSSVEQDA